MDFSEGDAFCRKKKETPLGLKKEKYYNLREVEFDEVKSCSKYVVFMAELVERRSRAAHMIALLKEQHGVDMSELRSRFKPLALKEAAEIKQIEIKETPVMQRIEAKPMTMPQPIAAMPEPKPVTIQPAPIAVQEAKPASAKSSLRGMLFRKLKERKTAKPRRKTVYPKFLLPPQKELISIEPKGDMRNYNITYPLISPYASANIRWNPEESALVYYVAEPELSEHEKNIFSKLSEGLIMIINVSIEDIRKHEKMIEFLEENIQRLVDEYGFILDESSYMKIMYYVFRDFIGLNEIEPLLRDPFIEDIACDGTGVNIYIVHQRFGSIKTNIAYNNLEKLKEFVTKLAERCDRYISYAEPLLDGALPDGTRVHATVAGDVTTHGPTFSIRKFREVPFSPVDMIRMNTASSEMLAYLWFVVESGANILITGAVATGKTSFLNTLSLFIPQESKVVSIEDTRELMLPHENWIPGVARAGFTGTGVGEVTMFDLLKESFRQNPDYLIVGEIRGKEAYVMFQSMASGHPSMSTIHAGSVDDVMKRLRTEPISLSPGLLETLDIVIIMVHAREKGKSARRAKEVIEIESIDIESGRPRISKAFVWLPSRDSFEYRGDSWVLSKISTEKGMPMGAVIRDISRRKKLLEWMSKNNIVSMSDIVKYISLYHRNPESIKSIIGEA